MTRHELPPGLSASAAAQGFRFFQNPLSFLDQCVEQFGDLFTIQFPGSRKQVCLSNPEDLKEMYTGSPDLLHAGEAAGSVFSPLTGWNCTLTLDGEAHARRRELVQAPFRGGHVERHAEAMYAIATAAIERWPRTGRFPLQPQMQDIALRIIFRTVLGLDDTAPGHARFLELISQVASLGMGSKMLLIPALRWDLGPWSPWGRIVRIVRDTDALLFAEIARKRADPNLATAEDVLSLLIRGEGKDGLRLTDQEIRDETVALLIAGLETTAVALTWVAERLMALPEVRERLRAELEPLHTNGELDVTRLSALPYLDAVLKECLRNRSLSPICGGRVLKAPMRLREYELPADTVLINSPYLLHRRRDLYSEPDDFRPERFLGSPPSAHKWTTFGGGNRRCLGQKFALLELKVVTSAMVLQTGLELATPRVVPKADGIHLVPASGLPVRRGTCPFAKKAAAAS
ncbi:cytochrome P450 [Myxococcus stipitatus]|uniref:cytochrome P450 n=1 Tax=Myxococcus stipitatus TaxID=83455 RepID=UPI003145218E